MESGALKVLIIEDNRDLARLFCDLLEVTGCKASVAWSGKSGLELAAQLTPDIVFCDLGMPGEKDGYAVANELRSNAQFKNTQLIAVTGFDRADAHEQARSAGFDQVFAKPIKFAQIQQVIKNFHAARGASSSTPG